MKKRVIDVCKLGNKYCIYARILGGPFSFLYLRYNYRDWGTENILEFDSVQEAKIGMIIFLRGYIGV